LFTRAFRALYFDEDAFGAKQFPIRIHNPKARLGELNLARQPAISWNLQQDPLATVCGDGPTRHVALMRNNLQIVRYLELSQPEEDEEYAGVFITSREHEPKFARSEPPSHDDWVVNRLEKEEQTYVRVAFRRIREAAREFVRPTPQFVPQGGAAPLAGISQKLGELLPATNPPKEKEKNGGGGAKSFGSTPDINVIDIRSTEERNEIVREVIFTVEGTKNRPISIVAELKVVAEAGRVERSAPEGASDPFLLGWKFPDGRYFDAGGARSSVRVDADTEEGRVTFSQPADCKVRISLSSEHDEDCDAE
jgi:hypothetical protein